MIAISTISLKYKKIFSNTGYLVIIVQNCLKKILLKFVNTEIYDIKKMLKTHYSR